MTMLGTCGCDSCGAVYHDEPAGVVEAVKKYWPVAGREQIAATTAEMVGIASRWHQSPPWVIALTYRGINLGACMQVDLFPYIATGLTAATHSDGEEA